MLLLDVNIVLAALRPAQDAHNAAIHEWLGTQLNGERPVGVSDMVLSAAIRISTNRRAFREAVSPEDAVQFVDAVRSAPAARTVRPGLRHWPLFTGLVIEHGLRDNDVTDAYLAAMALELQATFVTRDRGFRRFRQLTTLDPLEGPA